MIDPKLFFFMPAIRKTTDFGISIRNERSLGVKTPVQMTHPGSLRNFLATQINFFLSPTQPYGDLALGQLKSR